MDRGDTIASECTALASSWSAGGFALALGLSTLIAS